MGTLRLLLALTVVVGHAHLKGGSPVLESGFSVRLFFIISGFYMALILNEKYVGPGAHRLFWVNRVLRLGPTYLLSRSCCRWRMVRMPGGGGRAPVIGQVGYVVEMWPRLGSGLRALLVFLQTFVIGQEWLNAFRFDAATASLVADGGPAAAAGLPLAEMLNLVPPAWSLSHELLLTRSPPGSAAGRSAGRSPSCSRASECAG